MFYSSSSSSLSASSTSSSSFSFSLPSFSLSSHSVSVFPGYFSCFLLIRFLLLIFNSIYLLPFLLSLLLPLLLLFLFPSPPSFFFFFFSTSYYSLFFLLLRLLLLLFLFLLRSLSFLLFLFRSRALLLLLLLLLFLFRLLFCAVFPFSYLSSYFSSLSFPYFSVSVSFSHSYYVLAGFGFSRVGVALDPCVLPVPFARIRIKQSRGLSRSELFARIFCLDPD